MSETELRALCDKVQETFHGMMNDEYVDAVNVAIQCEPLLDSRAALVAALSACELAMDTAAQHGVGDILPPAYRDSWAAAHQAARAALAKAGGA